MSEQVDELTFFRRYLTTFNIDPNLSLFHNFLIYLLCNTHTKKNIDFSQQSLLQQLSLAGTNSISINLV